MDERAKAIDWAVRNHETTWAAVQWVYDTAVAAERERCAGLFDVPLGINGEAEDWARAAAASIRGPVGRSPATSEPVVT